MNNGQEFFSEFIGFLRLNGHLFWFSGRVSVNYILALP